jgi:Domain of unknown function (DUF5666)
MKMSHLISWWLIPAVVVSLGSSPLIAQVSPAAKRVTASGKIVSLKGQDLLVTATAGEVSVKVTDATRITGEVEAKLSDIAPGVYVGATAQKQSDGTFRASRIHIFAEEERGLSEGHRPSTSNPGSTMTNANVERIDQVTVQAVKGPILSLKYKGGEVKVFVPPNIPIVKRVTGNPNMLIAGAEVRIQGAQSPDGTIAASQIMVQTSGS